MSKTSKMALTIEELRKCAAVISDAANWLAEQFSGDEVPEAPTPVKEPPLTLEAVRAVLANKSRAGHTTQIRSLLQKYGADKLSGVDPANYKALLADAEELNNAT
jgi:hypothetical protein